ncbi:hypothetical protein [Psychrosphaera algicola]|uniref:Uncharacterized protein n=1 Tax=Psychrosphaera algicola TaxID=3023714 RepID=A0ABT5FEK6_9GAMM|nr:hypothetical protein [Psychrosphaera sp. G1-22]MDC2889962.1 hypothetical protein [Psychrosphaera sp. G1-22]
MASGDDAFKLNIDRSLANLTQLNNELSNIGLLGVFAESEDDGLDFLMMTMTKLTSRKSL